MLGRFGKLPITSKSQEPVLKEINILNQVREQKGVTHRRYRPVLQSDLDAMLEKYSKRAHEINEIYSEKQQNLSIIDEDDSFSHHTEMTYIDYLKDCGVYDEGMSEDM